MEGNISTTKLVEAEDTVWQVEDFARLTAEAEEARVRDARAQAAAALEELYKAIYEHPDLTNLDKLAWLSAIAEVGSRHADSIEAIADGHLEKYKRVEAALAQEGVPVLLWSRSSLEGMPRISAGWTNGQGMSVDIQGNTFMGINLGVDQDLAYGYSDFVLRTPNGLINSHTDPEEVTEIESSSLFDNPNPGGWSSREALMVGQDAIVALVERIFELDRTDRAFYGGNTILKARRNIYDAVTAMGIDLEDSSETVKQVMQAEREEHISRYVENAAAVIATGNAIAFRDFYAWAVNEGIEPQFVLGRLKQKLKQDQAEALEKIDDLQRQLDETEAHNRPNSLVEE